MFDKMQDFKCKLIYLINWLLFFGKSLNHHAKHCSKQLMLPLKIVFFYENDTEVQKQIAEMHKYHKILSNNKNCQSKHANNNEA